MTSNPLIAGPDAVCLACGSSLVRRTVDCKEMLFGSRAVYRYSECTDCASLTTRASSVDLAAHYPAGYYSLQKTGLTHYAARAILSPITLRGQGRVFSLFERLGILDLGIRTIPEFGIEQRESILDVGCGQGRLLSHLHSAGYTRLWGVDPFAEPVARPGLNIIRGQMDRAAPLGPFDVIMFHHSLEHVASPADALRSAGYMLKRGGRLLVRLPLKDVLYETFGPDWVGVDAPRHTLVPTEKGIRLLMRRSGFTIDRTAVRTSAENIFLSRQHAAGIASYESLGSGFARLAHQLLSSDYRQCIDEARRMNSRGVGDEIIVLSRPVPT